MFSLLNQKAFPQRGTKPVDLATATARRLSHFLLAVFAIAVVTGVGAKGATEAACNAKLPGLLNEFRNSEAAQLCRDVYRTSCDTLGTISAGPCRTTKCRSTAGKSCPASQACCYQITSEKCGTNTVAALPDRRLSDTPLYKPDDQNVCIPVAYCGTICLSGTFKPGQPSGYVLFMA
jgi:hypothetical protein